MVPKFRAWDKEGKLWIKVASLVFDEEGEMWYLGPVMDDFNPVYYENELGKTWEIMQSTGLKDKNGVEVFQGDIVRCTRGCPHEVVWLQEYAGMYVGGMPAWYLSGLSEGYAWTGEEEIIGNIYENPELLDQANES